MKRISNNITCNKHFNKVFDMLWVINSGKIAFLINSSKRTNRNAHQMQTRIIMDNQCFLANLKKLAALTAMLIFGISAIFAQDTLLVKGTIVNGSNQPVSNVSVGIEGSFDLPTVTNEVGEFTVKSISGSDWLNVSPTNEYKKKRVFLNNRSQLKIYLTRNE
ncbi:MAG: hypothetical protein GQ525_01435, partial [Draconibacterium sp.]|nr:hypothetical protein [Draconibacterium sp.]